MISITNLRPRIVIEEKSESLVQQLKACAGQSMCCQNVLTSYPAALPQCMVSCILSLDWLCFGPGMRPVGNKHGKGHSLWGPLTASVRVQENTDEVVNEPVNSRGGG
jgi:hypothetical protein